MAVEPKSSGGGGSGSGIVTSLGETSTTITSFNLSTAGYATNEWALLANNSLSLTAGTWHLWAEVWLEGSTGTHTGFTPRWSTNNGDNTVSLPTAAVSGTGNITTAYSSRGSLEFRNAASSDSRSFTIQRLMVLSGNQDIYMNARAFFTVAGNHYIGGTMSAYKLRD